MNKNYNKKLIAGFFALIIIYLSYKVIISFADSYFIKTPNRVNIIFYAEQSRLISVGLKDNIHYLVNFDNNTYLDIPGGYGSYMVGSIGKLSSLEKNPEIITRAFSQAIGAYIDGYIIPKKMVIFDKEFEQNTNLNKQTIVQNLLFPTKIKTNYKLLDRLYLSIVLFKLKQSDLIVLKVPYTENKDKNYIIQNKKFSQNYAGFFYHSVFRQERSNLRIIYKNHQAAVNISRILEGQGIRVVDLEYSKDEILGCTIYLTSQSQSKYYHTIQFINKMFSCRKQTEDVAGVDIVVVLGDNIEKIWF